MLTCQERVSVAAHNTLDVAGGDVEKETFRHGCAAQDGNVLLFLNRRLLGREFVDVGLPLAKPRSDRHVILAARGRLVIFLLFSRTIIHIWSTLHSRQKGTMLLTIRSSTPFRTALQWTSQPFRSFLLSCVKRQANPDGQRPTRSPHSILKTYPELYELFRAAKFRINKELWAKLRAEPELLLAKQEESRYYKTKYLSTNPEYREKDAKRARAYFQAHKQDEAYLRSRFIYRWCFGPVDELKYTRMRGNLPWKTHLPVQQHEKTYRFYACCGIHRYMKTAVSIPSSHRRRIQIVTNPSLSNNISD